MKASSASILLVATLLSGSGSISCRSFTKPWVLAAPNAPVTQPSPYAMQLRELVAQDVNHPPLAPGERGGGASVTPANSPMVVGYTTPPEPSEEELPMLGKVAAPGYLYSTVPGKAIDVRGVSSGVILLDPWSGKRIRMP